MIRYGLPFTPNKLCCSCEAAVQVSVPSVNASETSNTPTPLAVTVRVLAVLSFTADILALNNFKASPVNATPLAVVVSGALISAARLALVTSAVPINTLPGVVPIEDTNVNTCPAIVTVSLAVGAVAKANTAVDVNWLETWKS